jgi:hypothetical protein
MRIRLSWIYIAVYIVLAISLVLATLAWGNFFGGFITYAMFGLLFVMLITAVMHFERKFFAFDLLQAVPMETPPSDVPGQVKEPPIEEIEKTPRVIDVPDDVQRAATIREYVIRNLQNHVPFPYIRNALRNFGFMDDDVNTQFQHLAAMGLLDMPKPEASLSENALETQKKVMPQLEEREPQPAVEEEKEEAPAVQDDDKKAVKKERKKKGRKA